VGAARVHVAVQFLAEAVVLASLGALGGLTVGALVTVEVARERGWAAVLPGQAPALGLLAALAIGTLAGLCPATRAARLSPTDALRAS
jgi:putative ABC transport system permease protein